MSTDIHQLPPSQPQVTFSVQQQNGPGLSVPATPAGPAAMSQGPTLTPEMQTEILSGIQNASRNGATALPSSHIPTDTVHLAADPQVTQTYTEPVTAKYIDEAQTIAAARVAARQNQSSLAQRAQLIEEMRLPLIIAGLFFLFQQSFLNNALLRLVPSLGAKDGNITIVGKAAKALLFGGSFYIFAKAMDHFNTF